MKILLVYPHDPDTFWSFRRALKFIGRKASFPVLGEAELTFPRFLADLRKGGARHLYADERWADLTVTPIPLWDLIEVAGIGQIHPAGRPAGAWGIYCRLRQ